MTSASSWMSSTLSTPPPESCVQDADNVHERARRYCLMVLTPVILLSNMAVLYILSRHRHFRRPDLLLIASLCCADVLVGVSAIAALVTQAKDATLSGCLVRLGLGFSAVLASILSLLAVACDRLLAIVRALVYQRVVTGRCAVGLVAALWVCSLLVGLLPVMGWNLGRGAYTGYCSFLLVFPASYVVTGFLCALLPILAILFIHAYLYAQARVHIRRIDALERVLGRKARGTLGMSGRSWRAIHTVSCVAGCVLACWCPFLLTSLYALLASRAPCVLNEVVGTHLLVLGYVNSALNPVVYAMRNRELRAVAARVLTTQTCQHNQT